MDFLDEKQLEAMAGGAPEFLLPILEDFYSLARTNLEKLQTAMVEGRPDEVRGIFHQLKGSSGTLGLRSLHELCAHFESTAKSGGVIGTEIPAQLEGLLDDSVTAARAFLNSDSQPA